MRNVPYPKPGEILLEEFLKPIAIGISAFDIWRAVSCAFFFKKID